MKDLSNVDIKTKGHSKQKVNENIPKPLIVYEIKMKKLLHRKTVNPKCHDIDRGEENYS